MSDDCRILHGDVIDMLRTLPEESVQCVVTSPPYWGLRDYGVAGQIGLEPTLGEYLGKMVEVFRAVRRVLRNDGVAWVNMGDAYAGNRSYQVPDNKAGDVGNRRGMTTSARRDDEPIPRSDLRVDGLKPKDMMGVPWRLAFALQADGWYLRDCVVWHKVNQMPESVRDRCTKSYEFIFQLSKSERYYFDADAISEAFQSDRPDMAEKGVRTGLGCLQQGVADNSKRRAIPGNKKPVKGVEDDPERHLTKSGLHEYAERQRAKYKMAVMPERRNRRNVWSIPSEPYPEAHFATFPTEIPRICILAASRAGDLVLDPFNGSGTTGQVAMELARRYVGCELNAEYVELTNRRLRRTTLGLPL